MVMWRWKRASYKPFEIRSLASSKAEFLVYVLQGQFCIYPLHLLENVK